MKTVLIKDLLILLHIHPDRGWVRRRNIIGYILLAAALSDLALGWGFRVRDGKIDMKRIQTGDPLLDLLSDKLHRRNGKKFSWPLSRLTMNINRNYRIQMTHLKDQRLISIRKLNWMGINFGRRYRVNRADSMRPLLQEFDRVLIYGRKPGIRSRLIIELLGIPGMLKYFFPDGELKKRAVRKYKGIARESFSDPDLYSKDFRDRPDVISRENITDLDITFRAIRKELLQTLRMQKAGVAVKAG